MEVNGRIEWRRCYGKMEDIDNQVFEEPEPPIGWFKLNQLQEQFHSNDLHFPDPNYSLGL